MARYPINKGIGRSAEFKGLKSQYLFLFVGGLLGVFVLFAATYAAGIDPWACLGIGTAAASAWVWVVFRLNARCGQHGLTKLLAAVARPRYLISRKRISKLFTPNR